MKRFWSAQSRLVVQNATPDDYDALARLHSQCFIRGWAAQEIERLDSQETVVTLTIRREGEGHRAPAGFLMIRQLAHEAEILSIAVHPDARGRGYGATLLRAAIAALQADRVERLVLEVDSTNEAALALYRQLGFRQVGLRKAYYRPAPGTHTAPPDALVLALDLL